MKGHLHAIVGEILCDFDGVFREDSKKFTTATKKLGIDITHVPVKHHEGRGERATKKALERVQPRSTRAALRQSPIASPIVSPIASPIAIFYILEPKGAFVKKKMHRPVEKNFRQPPKKKKTPHPDQHERA
jgi:hypothetical protein